MIVVDTNVLVRLITKDHIPQLRSAVALLSSGEPIWISRVVLLELAWVLRSRYEFSESEISVALHTVVSLDVAVVEDREQVQTALSHHRDGMDLGDAFVLACAPADSDIRTFDKRFVKKAAKLLEASRVQLVDNVDDEGGAQQE